MLVCPNTKQRRKKTIPQKTATEKKQAINAYNWKWNQQHTKQIKFKLNKNTDSEMIALLESLPNVQGYLKTLIRADMAAGGPIAASITGEPVTAEDFSEEE